MTTTDQIDVRLLRLESKGERACVRGLAVSLLYHNIFRSCHSARVSRLPMCDFFFFLRTSFKRPSRALICMCVNCDAAANRDDWNTNFSVGR